MDYYNYSNIEEEKSVGNFGFVSFDIFGFYQY
jgi:hypothetical protein